jgi:hypothetical protein
MGEEQRRQLFPSRQPGRFRVATEDNQLLPQHGVFGQGFSATAREIGETGSHQPQTRRRGWAAKELAGGKCKEASAGSWRIV